MTLISASELLAIQGVAESGMISTVDVYNPVNEQTEDGQRTGFPATPDFTVNGWLYTQTSPGATIGVLDGGEGLSQQVRLMVPVGTNIRPAAKVVVDGSPYYVQSTTEGETYPPVLRCYLRVIE
jgi:hypothetical protein